MDDFDEEETVLDVSSRNVQHRLEEEMGKRNGIIDMMRVVYAIIIVFLHATQCFLENLEIFSIGSLGVDFFFIVSGFLMAQSALKYHGKSIGTETWNFVLSKIGNFMPEAVTAWFIAFIVTESCREYLNIGMVAKDLLQGIWNIAFLQMTGLSGKTNINGVTWYLSAMILAMFLLFPILIRRRALFMNLIAPVVCVFIFGYLCKVYNMVVSPNEWNGLCYKGLLRAIAELSLGCICWSVCQRIRKLNFTKLGVSALTCMEMFCYALSVYWMWGHRGSKMDFVIVLMIALAVTISFSGKSSTYVWFSDERYALFCSRFSLYIYLGHLCWAKHMLVIFPSKSESELLAIYLFLIMCTVLVIHIFSKMIRWFMRNKWTGIERLFVDVP